VTGSQSAPGVRVELPTGWVEGIRSQDDLRIFKGIPYAAAPSGSDRWQPPKATQPWGGIRRCDKFGAVALQASTAGATGYVGDLDCLSLNIWCPQGTAPQLWPVMVWIPGGGFMRGGASDVLYDGSSMARSGIVFVSINYRLGVDGFMHFEDAAPNRGLQDQLAALRWVQENIALFGGDPSRITAAGVSAGAGSVAHLMTLPESDALFHRAILQSPSLQSHTLEDAAQIRHALAGILGIAPTREAIDTVPFATLTKTLVSFLGNEPLKKQWGLRPRNYFPVRPVMDGGMLQLPPLQALENRLRSGAPKRAVLLGSNAEEMRFYLVPSGEIDQIDAARVQAFASDIGWSSQTLDHFIQNMPQASMGNIFSCLQTDYYYRQPTLALEQLLRDAGLDAYLYQFEWASPLHDGKMGAAHAMEIPFVLGNTKSTRAQEFVGTLAPQALAQDMHARWAAFVKGQPMPDWVNSDTGMRIFK
jgi:para-nitrobenzyl esterase